MKPEQLMKHIYVRAYIVTEFSCGMLIFTLWNPRVPWNAIWETQVWEVFDTHNISETRSISVIRHKEGKDPTHLSPLEIASLDY
jgi:hypothetical protein